MKTNMKTDHIGRDRKPEPNLKKLKKKIRRNSLI